MIVIYTLEGCNICNKLKTELSKLSIDYIEVSCTQEVVNCERLERDVDCNLYPMCMIVSKSKQKLMICIAKESNQLNSIKTLAPDTVLTYVYSIDNMLNVIKNS